MSMKNRNMTLRQGFTVIELMIATAVFSVILLIVTSGIIQIGRAYEKGTNQSRTLNTARAITEEIADSIKFATGPITGEMTSGSSRGYCIGNKLFSYVRGQEVSAANHALVVSDVQACPLPLNPLAVAGTDRELLGDKMRVTNLAVNETPANSGIYTIKVRLVFGDDDLMCSPAANNCNSAVTMSALALEGATDLSCKNIRAGNQYCAVSELNTTVERRL